MLTHEPEAAKTQLADGYLGVTARLSIVPNVMAVPVRPQLLLAPLVHQQLKRQSTNSRTEANPAFDKSSMPL